MPSVDCFKSTGASWSWSEKTSTNLFLITVGMFTAVIKQEKARILENTNFFVSIFILKWIQERIYNNHKAYICSDIFYFTLLCKQNSTGYL